MAASREHIGEFENAIEHLYTTFAKYPLRNPLRVCDCCVSDQNLGLIYQSPLRQLRHRELCHVVDSLAVTWGDADDLRCFLPRLFESSCESVDPLNLGFVEIFKKLARRQFTQWPTNEQSAVSRFGWAAWQATLRLKPGEVFGKWRLPEPNEWLEGLARISQSLRTHLDYWVVQREPESVQHLLDFIDWHADKIAKRHHVAWSAHDDEIARSAIQDTTRWLTSAEFLSSLRSMAADLSRTPLGEQVEATMHSIAWWTEHGVVSEQP